MLMIFSLSTTAYVAVHSFVSWAIGVALIAPAVAVFWPDLRALRGHRELAEQPSPST